MKPRPCKLALLMSVAGLGASLGPAVHARSLVAAPAWPATVTQVPWADDQRAADAAFPRGWSTTAAAPDGALHGQLAADGTLLLSAYADIESHVPSRPALERSVDSASRVAAPSDATAAAGAIVPGVRSTLRRSPPPEAPAPHAAVTGLRQRAPDGPRSRPKGWDLISVEGGPGHDDTPGAGQAGDASSSLAWEADTETPRAGARIVMRKASRDIAPAAADGIDAAPSKGIPAELGLAPPVRLDPLPAAAPVHTGAELSVSPTPAVAPVVWTAPDAAPQAVAAATAAWSPEERAAPPAAGAGVAASAASGVDIDVDIGTDLAAARPGSRVLQVDLDLGARQPVAIDIALDLHPAIDVDVAFGDLLPALAPPVLPPWVAVGDHAVAAPLALSAPAPAAAREVSAPRWSAGASGEFAPAPEFDELALALARRPYGIVDLSSPLDVPLDLPLDLAAPLEPVAATRVEMPAWPSEVPLAAALARADRRDDVARFAKPAATPVVVSHPARRAAAMPVPGRSAALAQAQQPASAPLQWPELPELAAAPLERIAGFDASRVGGGRDVNVAGLDATATPRLAPPRWPERAALAAPPPARATVVPAVPATDAEPMFGDERVALDESQLDGVRGGFEAPGGVTMSFGIERAVYINGVLMTTTTLQVAGGGVGGPTASPALTLIQNGAGNSFLTSGASQLPIGGTVVQNTLNDQTIQNVTSINATVNSLQVLRSNNFESALRGAIVDSLRR